MISIRLMVEEDIPRIVNLENRWDYLSKWGEQGYRAAIANPFIYYCFVAVDGTDGKRVERSSEIVGLAILAQLFDHSELCNIIVAPEYLSRGVGLELLHTCFDLSEQLGLTRMLLEVRPSNTRAIRFYQKNGFQKIAERKDYYLEPRENAWVMEKLIRVTAVKGNQTVVQ